MLNSLNLIIKHMKSFRPFFFHINTNSKSVEHFSNHIIVVLFPKIFWNSLTKISIYLAHSKGNAVHSTYACPRHDKIWVCYTAHLKVDSIVNATLILDHSDTEKVYH